LAAVGAALQLQIGSATVAPELETQIREVLRILGIDAELEGVSSEALVALLAEIRLTFLQGVKLLYSSTLQPGWTHTEEELLQSQGQASAAFAPMFQRVVIPRLDGLAVRLESPTASFLDVGVGVAALSIAMARLWPMLRVVGIDPWEPALALARQNVAAAGLGERIELRQQAVEELAESTEFDLVWFPLPFIRADRLASALSHVWRALRPGGWIVSGVLNRTDEPLAAALADLRAIAWGGPPLLPAALAVLLEESGFERVQVFPRPSWAAIVSVVGRRPLEAP
jgi:2-polyprenyl-3-methyl-5-hydroxy-6-metoxy-1,4-benzoquinol methylase